MKSERVKYSLLSLTTERLGKIDGEIVIEIKHENAKILAEIYEGLNTIKLKANDTIKTKIMHWDTMVASYAKTVATQEQMRVIKSLKRKVKDELDAYVAEATKEAQEHVLKVIQDNKNLSKDVKKQTAITVGKVSFKITKVLMSVGKLVASAGAKADEYVKILKNLKGIYDEIVKATRSEEKVRADLIKALSKLEGDAAAVSSTLVDAARAAAKDYENKLKSLNVQITNMAQEVGDLVDHAGDAVKLDNLLKSIDELNEIEDEGEKFLNAAYDQIRLTKGKFDLKSALALGGKLAKALQVVLKVKKALDAL
jgi:ABC-type transporter Mla subunit MlaD